ncbi:unnamed protein product, partial [Ectocarpus sp. 12 AP-2014]
SPGPDALSAKIISHVFNIYPNLLKHLYNKCLDFASFPERWKTSVVKIIPKCFTVEPTAKSFRPISLLNVLGKILEKLIYDRLLFWTHNSPTTTISTRQYGFMPQKSAEDAINEVVKRQRKIRDSYHYGIVVSLDISSAFDCASWKHILATLKNYQIPSNIYYLIENYFSNRRA